MGNAYTAGDVLPFAIQTTDANGAPANTSSVSVSIILPDGSTAGPYTPTNPSTGVYRYDYTTTTGGRFVGQWTVGGTIAGGEPQAFWVMPANPPVTIGEMRDHLGVLGQDDDAELVAFILAAIPIVESVALRDITPRTVSYTTTGGRSAILLPDFATTVTSVTENGAALSTAQYDYDSRSAILYRKGAAYAHMPFAYGNRNITVTYTTGSSYPAANVQMAVKETVKYLWRQTKTGPDSFQDGYVSAAAVAGVSQAMRDRIANILGNESGGWLPL